MSIKTHGYQPIISRFISVRAGLDYAYTLQGWIKGVNSNLLTPETDMGVDGGNTTLPNGKNNPNHLIARDAFGYTLGYFDNDYTPIDNSKWVPAYRFEPVTTGSSLMAARNDLFNGNISYMQTTIRDISNYTSVATATTVVPLIIGNAYKYDLLNRLHEANSFNNIQTSGSNINTWLNSGAVNNMYKNAFTYDANGNIIKQQRYDQNGILFDDLTYNYLYEITGGRLLKNRLYHVNDNVSNTTLQNDDIEDQGVFNFNTGNQVANPMNYQIVNQNNNYTYDEIGNLTKDESEEILSIAWTVYGKLDSIIRTPNSIKPDIKFLYDASGNRIAKIEKTKITSGVATGSLNPEQFWKTTYYVRDAQGNVMATYKSSTNIPSGGGDPTQSYKLTERHIYGSARVGLDVNEVEFIGNAGLNPSQAQRVLGKKQYELSNHLGNVLTVITDRKIPVDANNDFITDYYLPDVISSTDYYAFGAPMPGRTFNSNQYRFGFNGKENDNEVKGTGNQQDYGMRVYDPRIGKFLSVDPLFKDFAWNSTYAFAENDVIRSIDLDGAEKNFVVQYKDKSGAMLWHTVPYSKIHPGVQNGPLGKGDYVYAKDPKTGQFSGNYVKTYKEANPIRATLQDADHRYEDKQGFKTLGNDIKDGGKALGKASTYVKGAGVVITLSSVVLGPEVIPLGVATYNVGGRMEDVSAVIAISSAAAEGDVSGTLTEGTKFVAGKAVGGAVKGTNTSNGNKVIIDYVGGKGVDALAPSEDATKKPEIKTEPK